MATHAPRPLRLTTLVDQQLWYIGHDIRHADGNALARFGFERRRGASGGTSCYRLPSVDPSRQLLCWGFGAARRCACRVPVDCCHMSHH